MSKKIMIRNLSILDELRINIVVLESVRVSDRLSIQLAANSLSIENFGIL